MYMYYSRKPKIEEEEKKDKPKVRPLLMEKFGAKRKAEKEEESKVWNTTVECSSEDQSVLIQGGILYM